MDYVIRAVEWIALHGWALMCQYRCNHRTGEVSVLLFFSLIGFLDGKAKRKIIQWRHFSRQGKPLGRTERKWLSHYDLGYRGCDDLSPERKPLDQVFREAFENAEFQLSIAKNDQKYLSQALKMSDDDGILSINDELDILRWYVYPKECAQALKLGYDKVPGTESKENILGAIRPYGYFEPLVLHPTAVKRKAKNDNEKGSSPRKHMKKDERMDHHEKSFHTNICDEEGIHAFRDGEDHSGQATLHEIIEGFDDSELSEKCIVFLPDSDEWLPVEEIKKRIQPSKSNETAISVSQMPVKEEKKPSRDSSAWGKNNVSQITVPAISSQVDENIHPNGTSTEANTSRGENDGKMSNKRRKALGKIKPPAKMMRYITQAMVQWDMVKDGDKLLLGLSGGKDSLSLLHCLLEFKRKLKIKFEIEGKIKDEKICSS